MNEKAPEEADRESALRRHEKLDVRCKTNGERWQTAGGGQEERNTKGKDRADHRG